MIVVTTQGRLGNQLFQYAFAYSLSRSLGTSFLIYNSEFDRFSSYFKLRPFENLHMLLRRVEYKVSRRFRDTKRLTQSGWDETKNILQIGNNYPHASWMGFFQSLLFFDKDIDKIRRLFEMRRRPRLEFERKYKQLFERRKVAVIHVRRTDYLEWGNDRLGGKNMTLPMQYYDRCIKAAGGLQDHHTIVLSDDTEFVKTYFGSNGFFFEHNNEIVDFQLLTNADVLILSNSTFAWWAAVLNKRNSKVYGPKYWLGFKIDAPYPVNIMDGLDWTWIDARSTGINI